MLTPFTDFSPTSSRTNRTLIRINLKGENMQSLTDRAFSGRWLIGGALISLGIMLVLMNIGVVDRVPIWKYWPVIFIVIGLNKMLQPYNRAEGFWWVAFGLWFLVNTLEVWGLTWGDTWPAMLIILGVTWMWQSFERETLKRKRSEQKIVEF
jgi:hypothetical protein